MNKPTYINPDCEDIVIKDYEYQCVVVGDASTNYNTECGWILLSSQHYLLCDPPSGGGSSDNVNWPPGGANSQNPQNTQNPNPAVPCNGDVIKDPKIARSSATNVNGGRFGPTRKNQDGSPKMHKGLDILAYPNTPIYAAFAGIVTRSVSIYPTNYYGSPASFGNLIEIESTVNGQTIRMLYGHLNSVAGLHVGSSVAQGQQIALSGRTGNAQKGFSPHVHVQVTLNGVKVNPENYLSTKFDSAGNSTGSPCN